MNDHLLNKNLDLEFARKGGQAISFADGTVAYKFYGILLSPDAAIASVALYPEWTGDFTGSGFAGMFLPIQGTSISLSAGSAILFKQI